MAQIPNVKLNNGIEMPIIGSGAHSWPDKYHTVIGWVSTAIQAGFRHIDTAQDYGTEKFVGEAIRKSGIPREEFFVTTKLPWNHQDRVKESFEESLQNLDLGYIDLYLIHFPQFVVCDSDGNAVKNANGVVKTRDDVSLNDVWAEMEKLLETGKVKAIGVSNFSEKTLGQLFKTAKVTPAVNQVEMHPYLAQNGLRKYCEEKGIAITAYAPSGYSEVRNDPTIVELAKKYNTTPNQVILAWHLSRNTTVVPKSVDAERQKENITLVKIEKEDLEKIDALDRNQRICNKADETGTAGGWTYEQLGW
ncbi:Alcohol dehydrogenase [NADP(+)] [Leucoagaricus sp. SymC.cos]|nr:Alcohol dehydrogenase [NADP(+)] [Leucoagaricus sp. SymC.cos]